MLTRLMPAAFLLAALTGCASREPPPPPPAALVPASALAPCPRVQVLPTGPLTETQIEILWGRDRAALRRCAAQIDTIATILKE